MLKKVLPTMGRRDEDFLTSSNKTKRNGMGPAEGDTMINDATGIPLPVSPRSRQSIRPRLPYSSAGTTASRHDTRRPHYILPNDACLGLPRQ